MMPLRSIATPSGWLFFCTARGTAYRVITPSNHVEIRKLKLWNCDFCVQSKGRVCTKFTFWTRLRVRGSHHDALAINCDSFWLAIFLYCAGNCVVATRIEATVPKNIIFMQSTDLWPCGRSRGAKSSKESEKCDFLVFQRCGNACFRWKQSKPFKNNRTEGGTYHNRPSRSRWSQKFGDLFALGRANCRYLRFRDFECHIFARSVHILSKIDHWKVAVT